MRAPVLQSCILCSTVLSPWACTHLWISTSRGCFLEEDKKNRPCGAHTVVAQLSNGHVLGMYRLRGARAKHGGDARPVALPCLDEGEEYMANDAFPQEGQINCPKGPPDGCTRDPQHRTNSPRYRRQEACSEMGWPLVGALEGFPNRLEASGSKDIPRVHLRHGDESPKSSCHPTKGEMALRPTKIPDHAPPRTHSFSSARSLPMLFSERLSRL